MMITFCCPETLLDTPSPEEKGYPSIITPVSYFVGCQYPHIVGYTSFKDMGDFYFVGNTYVMPDFRGQGLYNQLLSDRNDYLHDKPKVALANPIEDTDISILKEQVAKQGGVPVYCYTQVSDLMTEEVYYAMVGLPMFIYR